MKHIIHQHSINNQLPDPNNLEYGEIAINCTVNNEGLYIKNSRNKLVKIWPSDDYKDLSMYDIYGNLQPTRETANCYVISEPGNYKFPIVCGNAIKNGKENTAAFTNAGGTYQANFLGIDRKTIQRVPGDYCEIYNKDTVSKVIGDYVKNCIVQNGFVCFNVPDIPNSGANILIRVMNSNNELVWGWHIWLWKEDLTPIEITNYSGNTYNILPVNIASKYSSNGKLTNWYYQWGRVEPLCPPNSYNSNSNNSTANITYVNYNALTQTISKIRPGTGIFYKMSNDKYSWINQTYYYNYWDASCNSAGANENNTIKTVYDPCPRGFKVPNARIFTGFTDNGESTGTVCSVGSWDNGWKFKANSNDTTGVFFPASGYRDGITGLLNNVGNIGYYWTTGSAGRNNNNRPYSLYITNSEVSPLYTKYRGDALSIRPVADV